MKPDHILIPRAVGPDTNPKNNGWYVVTLNTESFHKDAFFDIETGWDESVFSSNNFPAIWYEEVLVIDHLREKLKNAFNEGYNLGFGYSDAKTFDQWFNEEHPE